MHPPRLPTLFLSALILAGPTAAPAAALLAQEGPDAVAAAPATQEAAPAPRSGTATPSLDDPAFLERARAYTRGSYLLFLIDEAWTVLILGGLVFSGASAIAWEWIRERAGPGVRGQVVYVAGLVILVSLLTLPLDYYHGFVREHAYGFSTQTARSWAGDRLATLALAVVLFALFFIPVYALIRKFPRRWWLLGAALGCTGATLLVAVAPVAIEPIFNDFTPLRNRELREKILALAARDGIDADEVWQMDASTRSVHDNAYVSGLLGSERIVLYDNLIENYSPDEILFVMGHEMGHYVLGHVWKGLALVWILIVAGFWAAWRAFGWVLGRYAARTGFTGPGDFATLPLLLLIISLTLFVTLPVQSAWSRHLESRADRFALETVDHPEAAIPAFRKMAARNLADPDPPALVEWFLYSHPSMGERIRAAETFLARRGSAP